MDLPDRNRLSRLRAVLAGGRLEKASLMTEIESSYTTPARKLFATRRYSTLMNELRMAANELESVLAVYKKAEQTRNRAN
jgi:hypothetical protein